MTEIPGKQRCALGVNARRARPRWRNEGADDVWRHARETRRV